MSTLAIRAAGVLASAVQAGDRPGLVQRLLAARENQPKRHVIARLAAMDDARLKGLGFSADDISALRAGGFRLPR
jgi:hypothetical protein